jgi:hypothetical protein
MQALDEPEVEFENGNPKLRYKNGGATTEGIDELLDPSIVLSRYKLIQALKEKHWSDPSVILNHYRLIQALKEMDYIFDNPDEIDRFLRDNSFLQDILLEAPEYIYRIFGRVPLHLEYFYDPNDSTEELFILIKSPFSISKSITLEDQLFEDWFYDKIDSTRGKLNIVEEPA